MLDRIEGLAIEHEVSRQNAPISASAGVMKSHHLRIRRNAAAIDFLEIQLFKGAAVNKCCALDCGKRMPPEYPSAPLCNSLRGVQVVKRYHPFGRSVA